MSRKNIPPAPLREFVSGTYESIAGRVKVPPYAVPTLLDFQVPKDDADRRALLLLLAESLGHGEHQDDAAGDDRRAHD